ncbi:MAG TPA: hypothetical protein VFL86_27575 [Burkholderiaceae bacterium]|nr:hypothetical protein [Burkholderiaceae bacterium]
MRSFSPAPAHPSWRWSAVLAMVLGGVAACGSGGGSGEAAPQAAVGELELLAGLPRSSVPQSGVLGGIRTPFTMDAQGNLYGAVGNFECDIRRVSADGTVATVARLTPNGSCNLGNEKFISIDGLVRDAAGNLYISDGFNAVIRKVTPDGVTSVLAGTERAIGTEDGTGPAARFFSPKALAVDAAGNVFVADEDSGLRRVSPEGVVTSLRSGLLSRPTGVAVDAAGSVYTMDSPAQRLIKFTKDGTASVLAGTIGSSSRDQTRDGPGDQASFFRVLALAMDAQGNVYLGDDVTLRKVTPSGVVSTLAGRAGDSNSLDGRGSAARFRLIVGMAADPGSGRLVVADGEIGLRTVASDGSVATPGGRSSFGSSDGKGTQARFSFPQGVTTDALGNAYVADRNNGTVRKVSGAGEVTTFAGLAFLGGLPEDGVGSSARFSIPSAVASDTAGNLFVIDSGISNSAGPAEVRKVTPQASVSTLFNLDDVLRTQLPSACVRLFAELTDVAVDAAGSVYFVGPDTGSICKFTTQGQFVLVAGDAEATGSADGSALAARFFKPTHLAFDAAGNLYVSDAGNHTVRKISPAGTVSTVAGQAGQAGNADGMGIAARFSTPGDLAVAQDGSLYVADTGNRAVRRLAPDGAVSTFIRAEGTAGLGAPTALAIGSGGRLYIADDVQNVLWRARLP